MHNLEVIATCVEDVHAIVEGGAQRIELVSGLTEGGMTPSVSLIERAVRVAGNVPVMAMIRPHSMSFHYSQEDIDVMIGDIIAARVAGAAGVVLGALTESNEIDRDALSELFSEVGDIQVTFHKAIDDTPDPVHAVDILREYFPKVNRILTAGGHGSIMNNVEVLRRMREAAGNNISIQAGGGVTRANLGELARCDAVDEYHVGTTVRVGKSPLGAIDRTLVAECVGILKGGGKN